jgi:hypothetical protein
MIYFYTVRDSHGEDIESSSVTAEDQNDAENQISRSLFHRELFNYEYEITGSIEKVDGPIL